jgi:hypothetical protein
MHTTKFILLIALVCTSFFAGAQQIGTYTLEDIGKQVSEPTGKYYYANLLQSFNNDANLDADALTMLYYGYSTQEAYKPYESWLLEKELIELDPGKEPEKTISVAESLLQKNPVSLLAHNRLYWAYRTSDKSRAEKHKAKFEKLAKAVKATGAGKKIEAAPVLISLADKYAYLKYLSLSIRPKDEYMEQDNQQYNVAYYGNPASPVITNKLFLNITIPYQKDNRLKADVEKWVSERVTKK